MAKTIFYKKIENTSTIVAGAVWQPTEAQLSTGQEIDKHTFFNTLTIHNDSDKDIEVRLNGTSNTTQGVELLHAGDTMIWDADEGIAFRRPAIYNRDTSLTIAVSEIIMIIRKVIK